MRKLKTVKSDILRWNKTVFGNIHIKMGDLEHKVSRLDEKEA